MNSSDPKDQQSNYSHEEMLDNLRSRERGNGGDRPVSLEVVEGTDGNQIIKEVKKRRRRRTHQPKKIRERRIRLVKKILLCGSISVVLLLAAFYALMLFGIRGQRFRASVGERVSELVNVDIGFGSFRLNGLNLDNSKAVINDVPGSLFHGAEVTSLRTRVSPWTVFSGDWHLGPVHAGKGEFRFGLPDADIGDFGSGRHRRPGQRLMTMAGFGLDHDPGMINCNGIRIADCGLYWEEEGMDDEPFLAGSVVNISDMIDNSFQLRFKGGELKVPEWPALKIESVSGLVQNGKYQVRESIFSNGTKGSVTLSGFINAGSKGDFRLTAPFTGLSLSDNVHTFWQDKLRGHINGEMEISGSLAGQGSLLAEGTFSSNNLVLSNHPILQRLAIGLGEALLARIDFHSVEGRLKRTTETLEIYDLRAVNPALFQLRGGITVHSNGTLEGQLDVGIPAVFLQRMGIADPSIFGAEVQGFSWTKVQLGGVIGAPEEDLTGRLEKIRAQILKDNLRRLP
jgi:hypothetical protein